MKLQEFFSAKSHERTSRFVKKAVKRSCDDDDVMLPGRPSSSTTKPKISKSFGAAPAKKKRFLSENVKINVGIAKENENGDLCIARGSLASLDVRKAMKYEEVLKAAINKHAAHNQFFDSTGRYALVYPDFKVARQVPATDASFTVEGYKKELGKPYSKLNLFLCREIDLECNNDDGEEKNAKACKNKSGIPDEVCVSDTSDQSDDDAVLSYPFMHPNIITDFDPSPLLEVGESNSKLQETAFPPVPIVSGDIQNLPANSFELQPFYEIFNRRPSYDAKMRCPICNLQFSMKEIEQHADSCLQKKETPLIFSEELVAAGILEDDDNDVNFEEQPAVDSDWQGQLVTVIKSCQVSADEIAVNIRRGNAFSDFTTFFKRKWNRSKWCYIYRVNYIGEAGIDTGGVSREFYTGAYIH